MNPFRVPDKPEPFPITKRPICRKGESEKRLPRILVHCSNEEMEVIKTSKCANGEICFSEGVFISYFGSYLYLFDFYDIARFRTFEKKHFEGNIAISGSIHRTSPAKQIDYTFHSKKLKSEWIVREDIDVIEYSIGVIQHWNYTEGEVELRRGVEGKVISHIKM